MPDDSHLKDAVDDRSVHGLSRGQRWAASLVGLTAVGTGGAGVFLSENQAGTTRILLLGAAFLLMGVQRTPIISASKEGIKLQELREKAQELTETGQDLADAEQPKAAAEVAEAAVSLDPSVRYDPAWRHLQYQIYELQAFDAVSRAMSTLKNEGALVGETILQFDRSGRPNKLDAEIEFLGDSGKTIGIEIKKTNRADMPYSMIRHTLGVLIDRSVPALLIANQLPGAIEGRHFQHQAENLGIKIELVRWQDERDDGEIVEALRKLLKTIEA